jgi:creatinine amidohydrolase/Fe(II)-dependent formamide hydrolase-like protein
MRYELMLPREIRAAIDGNWPVVLAVGVLEYHGEHMAVGMDTLAVVRILEILETDANLVILPPFSYGAASYAVEPPEGTGTLHVDAEALVPLAKAMFTGLLRIGFRNIHLVIHHQTENFAAGMPTDLAFKLAARQAIFAFLEAQRGEGWWGAKSMADYYEQQSTGDDPFNWIKAHPLMPSSLMEGYPFDHAGQGETSLLMALLPEGVDISRISEDQWYSRSAREATLELGLQGRDRILAHLRKALGVERANAQGARN